MPEDPTLLDGRLQRARTRGGAGTWHHE
jgi:hypothetical protein